MNIHGLFLLSLLLILQLSCFLCRPESQGDSNLAVQMYLKRKQENPDFRKAQIEEPPEEVIVLNKYGFGPRFEPKVETVEQHNKHKNTN